MPPTRDKPPYSPQDLIGGKYAVRKVLGEGGMAVVYAAVDTSCDRQVAIKVLRPSVAKRQRLSDAQMLSEASILVKLHDRTPHVAEVLTAGITDDRHRLPYYVMERLYGTTLRAGISDKGRRRQPFEIIEATSTITEVATALAHAHQMGVVHRDVKPENVYIAEQRDQTYIAKLLDFGISALAAEIPVGDSESRVFAGSRQYAAPEQLHGHAPAPAADVYALGLMLYEMLTFTLPHDRLNPALGVREIAYNVTREGQPRVRDLRADTPVSLSDVIVRCMVPEPSVRPSALQVANLLRDIKVSVERKLLGAVEETKVAITDVDGPPIEVLRQRFGLDADAHSSHVVRDGRPVGKSASTDPSSSEAGAGGRVLFFDEDDGPDHTAPMPGRQEVTEPMPLTALGPGAAPVPSAVVDDDPALLVASPVSTGAAPPTDDRRPAPPARVPAPIVLLEAPQPVPAAAAATPSPNATAPMPLPAMRASPSPEREKHAVEVDKVFVYEVQARDLVRPATHQVRPIPVEVPAITTSDGFVSRTDPAPPGRETRTEAHRPRLPWLMLKLSLAVAALTLIVAVVKFGVLRHMHSLSSASTSTAPTTAAPTTAEAPVPSITAAPVEPPSSEPAQPAAEADAAKATADARAAFPPRLDAGAQQPAGAASTDLGEFRTRFRGQERQE